jgi:two-component system chemotaxis response regulator CheB
MRRLLSTALERNGFEIVGTAADGDEALELCRRHRPDAMTLDLAMPGKDGIGVLRDLRKGAAKDATPVVVVSAFSPSAGARAVDALAEGAFDLVAKPAVGESLEVFFASLSDKLRAAASGAPAAPKRTAAPPRPATRSARPSATSQKVVMIACSTGGPRALAELIPNLPSPLGSGSAIVQHMPAGFTKSLAARLDRDSKLNVREAAGGESLSPDTILLAPGGSHLRVAQDGRVRLSDEDPIGGLRPRADLTIVDAARIYGRRLLLVVLTGMGKDGLEGAEEVRKHGGRILVEAERTCTVYGMPRAVAEAGLADGVFDLGDLPAAITEELAR